MKEKKILRNILIVLAIIIVLVIIRSLIKENIGINVEELSKTLQKTETTLLKAESGKEQNYKIDIYVKFGETIL